MVRGDVMRGLGGFSLKMVSRTPLNRKLTGKNNIQHIT